MERPSFNNLAKRINETLRGSTIEGEVKGILPDEANVGRLIVEIEPGREVVLSLPKNKGYKLPGGIFAVNYIPYNPGARIILPGIRPHMIHPWSDGNRVR